jgi:hypothetical protein
LFIFLSYLSVTETKKSLFSGAFLYFGRVYLTFCNRPGPGDEPCAMALQITLMGGKWKGVHRLRQKGLGGFLQKKTRFTLSPPLKIVVNSMLA